MEGPATLFCLFVCALVLKGALECCTGYDGKFSWSSFWTLAVAVSPVLVGAAYLVKHLVAL